MGKHLIVAKAICEFYRGESPQVIRCGEESTTNHKVFPDRSEWVNHKNQYCYCNKCRLCPNYISILFSKLSSESRKTIIEQIEKMTR